MSGDYDVDPKAFWTGAAAVAVIAGLAGVVTQLVLELVFDTTLVGYGGDPLTYGGTFLVATLAALVAGGLLHLFLMAVPKGRTLWQLLASLALIASLIPITQADMSGDAKLFLLVIHIVVYLFTVPTLVGLIGRVATPAVR